MRKTREQMLARRERRALCAVVGALVAMGACPLAALDTTLLWTVGNDLVVFSESVKESPTGFLAKITTNVGEVDSLVLDGRRSTVEWRRSVAGEGTDLVAARSGPRVRVSGTYRGKPYDATHDFGGLPWYQFQEISCEELSAARAAKGAFWTIDRASLKPSLFKAERREAAVIDVMGSAVRAVEWVLTVSGVPALLFTSRFWLRESDGRFLRLDVPPVFALPRSRVELTAESDS